MKKLVTEISALLGCQENGGGKNNGVCYTIFLCFSLLLHFFVDINELSKKINLDGLKLHNVGGVTQNRST